MPHVPAEYKNVFKKDKTVLMNQDGRRRGEDPNYAGRKSKLTMESYMVPARKTVTFPITDKATRK